MFRKEFQEPEDGFFYIPITNPWFQDVDFAFPAAETETGTSEFFIYFYAISASDFKLGNGPTSRNYH